MTEQQKPTNETPEEQFRRIMLIYAKNQDIYLKEIRDSLQKINSNVNAIALILVITFLLGLLVSCGAFF